MPAPLVDCAADAFVERRHDDGALRVLVVEGACVLSMGVHDAGVFLEATFHDTRERRRARARDVDSPFVERVLEVEHARTAPQAAMADVVLDRDFHLARRA